MKLSIATQEIAAACRTAGHAGWYNQASASLITFLGDDLAIESLTTAHLQDWKNWLAYKTPGAGSNSRLSVETQRTYIKAVKALYKRLDALGYIDHNPTLDLRPPKAKRSTIKPIAPHCQQKMLKTAKQHVRDYAILRLYAATGARLSEFVGLRMGDIEIYQLDGEPAGRCRIIGKGEKERLIFFKKKTVKALNRYFDYRPDCPSDALFLAERSPYDPLTARGLEQIFKRWGKRAGIPKPFNPHSFRHAFAKGLIANGADIKTVADLLGHEDPAFTARVYLQWTDEELAQRHALFAPLD